MFLISSIDLIKKMPKLPNETSSRNTNEWTSRGVENNSQRHI